MGRAFFGRGSFAAALQLRGVSVALVAAVLPAVFLPGVVLVAFLVFVPGALRTGSRGRAGVPGAFSRKSKQAAVADMLISLRSARFRHFLFRVICAKSKRFPLGL